MESTLTFRAEQALPGAMLLDLGSAEEALTLARVTPEDFKHGDHWLTCLSVRAGQDMPGRQRYLTALRGSCPVARHGPAYATWLAQVPLPDSLPLAEITHGLAPRPLGWPITGGTAEAATVAKAPRKTSRRGLIISAACAPGRASRSR